MRKVLSSSIPLLLVLSMAGTSFAVVIGDFENRSMDGWELSWEGDSVLGISNIGATSGSGSLSVSAPPNKFSWTILKNMDPVILGIEHDIVVSMDVTWVASEWAPQQGMWLNVDLLAVNSNGPSGWQQVTPDDPVNPDWPGLWDPSWGDHTRTLSYDLSGYDATGATWLQVVVSMNGGNVTTAGKYYIDNISIMDASAPVIVADPVVFADANLKAAVEAELGISNPTQTDMLGLTGTFKAQESEIADLSGLEYATNLQSLWIYNNQITDLSPLAALKNLEDLRLQLNQITDVSPLANLTKLTNLSLRNNQIGDISPLANMVNLKSLYLYSNQITDISPLANMVNLETLRLQANQIKDISPLVNRTNPKVNLKSLYLHKNGIQSIDVLRGFTNLEVLNLSENNIQDISPLANLVNLKSLYLYSNQITDISPLANLTKLKMNATNLSLRENRIESVEALRGFTNLEKLYLWGNSIQDTSPLAGLTKLTYLNLRNNQIDDISPLVNLVNLETLYLQANQITDISPLANRTKPKRSLTYLNLQENRIESVDVLSDFTGLEQLYLWSNNIHDIGSLANLTKLVKLSISRNHISDIRPLASLTNLVELRMSMNQISDIGSLADLTSLEMLNCIDNQISHIDSLAQLTKLKNLQLGKNSITDIRPLIELVNLEFLVMYHNQIADLTPLSNMPELRRLMAHDNNIVDIAPLEGLDNLEQALLADNRISDISALADCTSLTWLDLRSNPLNEEAHSTYIPQIQHNNPLDHEAASDLFGTLIPAGLSYGDTILYEIAPKYHSCTVDITLSIAGAGFDPDVIIELVSDNGTTYTADNVEYISATEVEATFPAHSIPAGAYSLRASQGQSSASLVNAFEGLNEGSPNLVTSLELPDILAYRDLATIYVKYRNDGTVTVPAPLLHLTATQNDKQAALLTLDSELATHGLWASTTPEGFSNSIQILAQGSSPGRLHPGESIRVPVYWAGWLQPWDSSYPPINIGLSVLTANDNTPIDYEQMEQAIRPTDMDAPAWTPIWANFISQTGATWGDYVRMLDDNAMYLSRIDREATDVSELLTFEFAQANALNILPNLAGSTDARVTAPGLNIVLGRAFLPSISSRHRMGQFGRGWYHNWDLVLTDNEDDTVTVEGPFGSRRVFKPDGNGGYSSQAGDYGQLVETASGTYELIESNGICYAFSSGCEGRSESVAPGGPKL